MKTDAVAQLTILTDALTQIVDLVTDRSNAVVVPDDLLARVADVAAAALAAAATYGQLPPFPVACETQNDARG